MKKKFLKIAFKKRITYELGLMFLILFLGVISKNEWIVISFFILLGVFIYIHKL